MENKDKFTYQGVEFEVSAEWLRGLCNSWAIEDAENTVLKYGSKESYIEGRTDSLYENIEASEVYEYAVKAGLIEDTLELFTVKSPEGFIKLHTVGDKKGTWVIVATNTYSYDNMEQHMQVAFTPEEGSELFFDTVNWYLKDEKSTLADNFGKNGLSLKDYMKLAQKNGEELQYGIEDKENSKLFTIFRKKLVNDGDTHYDYEEVKIRLSFVPLGEKVSIIGEPMLENVEDVELLFKKA